MSTKSEVLRDLKFRNQSGMSIVELVVGAAILAIVFGSMAAVFGQIRKSSNAQQGDGHHLHFETFASARLRLYFAKLLQWGTHLSGESDDNSEERKKSWTHYCEATSNFAYAHTPLPFNEFTPEDKEKARVKADGSIVTKDGLKVYEEDEEGNPVFLFGLDNLPRNYDNRDPGDRINVWLNKTEIPYKTLAADIRMSLSSLSYQQVMQGDWKTSGLLDKYEKNEFLWAAMVPFTSGGFNASENVDSLWKVNPNLAQYCDPTKVWRPKKGFGEEMCRWVDWCSAHNRGTVPNPESCQVEGQECKILSYTAGSDSSISTQLDGISTFRMCFAYVGNMFSKSGDFYNGTSAQTSGAEGIDNPAAVAMAVATARIVDNRTGEKVKCEDSIYNMNRSMKVRLHLYTVLAADKKENSGKQIYHKSVKEFTSEKIAMDRPNCRNKRGRHRLNPKNQSGQSICIADPLFHYVCSEDDECGDPDLR